MSTGAFWSGFIVAFCMIGVFIVGFALGAVYEAKAIERQSLTPAKIEPLKP